MSKIQTFSYFEAILGVVGLFLIYIYPGTSIPDWSVSSEIFINTAIYLIPLLFLAICFSMKFFERFKPLERIQTQVRKFASTFLWESHPVEIFFLSMCAGLGEEILFRGFFQVEFGIVAASLIFGLLHSITLAYFIIATAMGFYLGHVFETTNSLWPAILIHGFYDFFALMLLKWKHQPTIKPEDSQPQNDSRQSDHDQ